MLEKMAFVKQKKHVEIKQAFTKKPQNDLRR